MRVIHYISSLSPNTASGSVAARMMMACTSKAAETHLLTATPLSEEYLAALKERYGISVHLLPQPKGKSITAILSCARIINKVLKEVAPDVVHVHGSWDFFAGMVERLARRKGLVTIVSPHRGMSQEVINIDFWKHKLPRLLAYQIWMVRRSTLAIAENEAERESILSLGLKKRIEVMPGIPKEIEAAGMLRDSLMAAYRKALDSTYSRRITQRERDFVKEMVRAAVVDDDVEIQKPDIQGLSFRHIFFYAYDEDVTELLLQGAQKLSIALPPTLNVEAVPRYTNRKAKQRGSINDVPMQKKVNIPQTSFFENVAVEQIAKSHSLTMERLTLRRYVELYQMFRYSDFDEDVVAKELKRLGLKRYTKRLQKALRQMFALKPGYDIY